MPSELSEIVSAFSYFHPFDELLFSDGSAQFYEGLCEDLLVLSVLIVISLFLYARVLGSMYMIDVVGYLDGVKEGISVKVASNESGSGKPEIIGVYYSLGRKLNPRFDWCDNQVLFGRFCTELKNKRGCSNTKIAYMKSSLESIKKNRARLLIDDPDDLWKSGLISRKSLISHDSDLFYIIESEENVSKD
jgi:hypothetical protein